MRIKFALTLILLAAAPLLAIGGVSFDPSLQPNLARQLGMGGTSLVFSDDASGLFYNPAGLADVKLPQIVAASRQLVFESVDYTLIGWAMPTEHGTFGIGYTSLNTGGSLPTVLDPATGRVIINPSAEVSSYINSTLIFSYAKTFEQISLGINYKMLMQQLGGSASSTASGNGIDVGLVYPINPWLTVGANLQNIIKGSLAWAGGETDQVGGNYKVGCKINIMGTNEALIKRNQTIYGGIDLSMPHISTTRDLSYSLGIEYLPIKTVSLRTGVGMGSESTGLNFGIGFLNGGFRFDYCYATNPNLSGDMPHYFSLAYVGERVVKHLTDKKAKKWEPSIVFKSPVDRTITDKNTIEIIAVAKADKIIDKTTVWQVTGISATKEVKEVKLGENLSPVYLNGLLIKQTGTVSTSASLIAGRNVFQLVGYTPSDEAGKVESISGESRVLRFYPFKDTPMNYWAIRPIALGVTLGLIKGYPDNTFKPKKGITRAELITLLVRTLPNLDLNQTIESVPFPDVKVKHWATKFITLGTRSNLVTGYPDGSFKPKRVLTRAEGITVLARYAGLTPDNKAKPAYKDIKAGYWANKYIAPAEKAGLLSHIEKEFKPNDPFTRAEAIKVLYHTPQIQDKVNQFWETGIVSGGK